MEEEQPASSGQAKSLDKTKKLYRGAIELSKRLEELKRQKPHVRDIFGSTAISLRHRLRDLCLRLMFQHPLTFGRKAEEILWRKVFYDAIHFVKHSKTSVTSSSSVEAAYRTHLSSAAGFFQHLLLRLQREYGLLLHIDLPLYSSPRTANRSWSGRAPVTDTSPETRQWALNAVHRIMVYLGDIARYQQQWNIEMTRLSTRFYHQALDLCPGKGIAHNQLGTLCANKQYSIRAAYRYMRCLSCTQPFEGAEGNLSRVFERNRRRLHELDPTPSNDISAHAQQHRDVKKLLVNFLRLMDLFYNQSELASLSENGLQQQCHSVLHQFNTCLFYLPPLQLPAGRVKNDAEQPHSLTDELVFELLIMSVIAVHKLQIMQSESVAGALAFLLALFSHLLNHAVLRFQAVYEARDPIATSASQGSSTDATRAQNGDASRRVAPRRNRRRQRHAVDSDLSEGEEESYSPELSSGSEAEDDWISDDDELSSDSDSMSVSLESGAGAANKSTAQNAKKEPVVSSTQASPWTRLGSSFGALTTDAFSVFSQHLQPPTLASISARERLEAGGTEDALATRSADESESHHIAEITKKMANFVFETDTESSFPSELEKDESEAELVDSTSEEEQLQSVLTAAGTDCCLKAVKVMCDWLTVHPNLISSAAQSSLALWSRLAVLLNCLPRETDLAKPELYGGHETLLSALQAGVSQEFVQRAPLCEDRALREFPPLESAHAQLDFSSAGVLGTKPEALVRICCLRKFGYMLAAMPGVDFQYDTEQALFIGPQHRNHEETPASLDQEQRRGQLMRDMAQLRLQAEVSQLESSLQQSSAWGHLPAYLVPDSSALLQHTRSLRRLAASQRCILVIPSAAIAALDVLKTSSVDARDVIRWLEAEFKRGNRYLRGQRAHEEMQLGVSSKLRKTEPAAWQLLSALSCARYLRREAGAEGRPARGLVAQLCALPSSRSAALQAALDALDKEGMPVYSAQELCQRLQDSKGDG